MDNSKVFDPNFLHPGYKRYIDFAQKLYQKYQKEMLEIIGSYGFSNEIDLFCCVESMNMNANERSDIQQTAQMLLKEVFRHIRKEFLFNNQSHFEGQAKAAACYFVAYTDTSTKDKRMLSFPWLFPSQLLANYPPISDDEETNDFLNTIFNFNPDLYQWLDREAPIISRQVQRKVPCTIPELFEICFENIYQSQNNKAIEFIEMLIEKLINISKSN